MSDRKLEKRYRCRLCGDSVMVSDLRDHLASHSPAAESAIEDPTEFFEEPEALDDGTGENGA